MIQAYVLIEAEPTRVQDLMKELPTWSWRGNHQRMPCRHGAL